MMERQNYISWTRIHEIQRRLRLERLELATTTITATTTTTTTTNNNNDNNGGGCAFAVVVAWKQPVDAQQLPGKWKLRLDKQFSKGIIGLGGIWELNDC